MYSSAFFRAFSDRRFLAANAVAIASLAFLVFFPRSNSVETFLLAFFSYILLPLLFLRSILRERIFEYGISWGRGHWWGNSGIVLAALSLFILCVWGFLNFGEAKFLPSISTAARNEYRSFLISVGNSGVFNGMSCFFFQGFLLFSWRKRFGWKSIFWVTAFFISFLWAKGGFSFDSTVIFYALWSLLASITAFVAESALVAFCFLFFSDILLTVFLVSYL